MKYRIICLLTAAIMLVSSLPVYASSSIVTDVLAGAGIMQGDEKGNLNLSSNVSRAEFAKMAVAASPYKDDVSSSASSLFSDVSYKHWSAPYVKIAARAGYVSGYTDGSFRPNNTITLQETVSVVLKLLGYTANDYTEPFPEGALSLYRKIGLDENISKKGADPMTRLDCANLFYNVLNAKTKNGTVYCQSLGYKLGSDGKISYTDLMSQSMNGPIVVTDTTWSLSIKNANSSAVYKNNEISALDAISLYDVVYYSNSPAIIWAYSNRVSGTVDSISPNRTNPTSVTVAGRTYPIDISSEAAKQFSMYGNFKAGDAVTILLGKDDTVVYAVSADTASTAIYGIITSLGTTTLTNAAGYEYQQDCVTVAATDGQTYTYPIETSLEAGDLVSVSVSASVTSISKLNSETKPVGKVNSSATAIGKYALADDVQILDYNEDGICTVSPGRLSGVNFTASMLKFAKYNTAGEISHLILNNVTGDMYSYGILTEINASYVNSEGKRVTEYLSTTKSRDPAITASSLTYNYLQAGQSYRGSNTSKIFAVSTGPVALKTQGQTLSALSSLNYVGISKVGDGYVSGNSQTFKTGSNLQVYENRSGTYFLSSLEIVSDTDKYSLRGYYDKADDKGGRLRLIIATAK